MRDYVAAALPYALLLECCSPLPRKVPCSVWFWHGLLIHVQICDFWFSVMDGTDWVVLFSAYFVADANFIIFGCWVTFPCYRRSTNGLWVIFGWCRGFAGFSLWSEFLTLGRNSWCSPAGFAGSFAALVLLRLSPVPAGHADSST